MRHGVVISDMHVAPFTGAWIETRRAASIAENIVRRALHGRVD